MIISYAECKHQCNIFVFVASRLDKKHQQLQIPQDFVLKAVRNRFVQPPQSPKMDFTGRIVNSG